MTLGRAWLADLVEHALTEYLADDGSVHSSPSSDLFHYEQTLSNLRVTPNPSLLSTVRLIDTRDQRKEVKAEIGDLEHTVRATFTKAAFDRQAVTTSGVPFERLQVGAIFGILACEIRISDCFDPARVDIRITSVAVIHPGIGSRQFAKNLQKVENEPSVVLMLKEYTSRHSNPIDSDGNIGSAMTSQDEFFTQLQYQSLEAPSPVKHSPEKPVSQKEPLESERCPRSKLRQRPNVFIGEGRTAQPRQYQVSAIEEAAPSSAQFVTQMPIHVGEHSSGAESIPAETRIPKHPERTFQTLTGRESNVSTGAKDVTGKAAGNKMPSQSFAIGQSLWQKRTAGARYLPRYAGIRAQDQQDLIGDDASWQPSLAGRQLQGQVPLELLQELWQAADAIAEAKDRKLDKEESSNDEEIDLAHRSPRTTIAVESGIVDAVVQRSPSVSSSETSWEESPPRPAQRRPLLPPDSSPLQAREEAKVDGGGSRPHIDAEESVHRLLEAEPDITSSPPAIPGATQATFLDIGSESESDDQPNEINPSDLVPDADVRSAERSTVVVDTQLQKSSNDSVERGATSSLDPMQGVQVFRTPAMQRQQSGAATIHTDQRLDRVSDQLDPSLPQINQALTHPPSSQIVPATYIPQDPHQVMSTVKLIANEAAPACDRLPSVPAFGKGSSRPQVEELRNKRRRESAAGETSSKRQKAEDPGGKVVPAARDPDFRASEIVARQARHDFMVEERLRKGKEVRDREARERKESGRQKRDVQELQKRTRREEVARENEKRAEARRESEGQEKARQDRLAQCQPILPASVLNDDLSIESRDQALSPRSSNLKHHASTPITGASDYQVSNVSRDHLDSRTSRERSVAGAQDLFELFRVTYPDYKGGRTQFEQACQLLQDPEKSAPRAYLNDDFVFRYNNDYQEVYYPRVRKEGKLPVLFEQYYQQLEEDDNFEPRSVAKVLKPARLANMLYDHSFREGGGSIQGQPLGKAQPSDARTPSIAGNVDPQVSRLPARSATAALIENGSPEPRSPLKSVNNSQDSSIFITDWLKTSETPGQSTNTYGQASPELGTPPSDKLAGIPNSDLELNILAAKPAPGPKGTPRRVPWNSADKRLELPPSTGPARTTVIPALGSASARKPKPMDDEGKGKVIATAPRRRQTDFPLPSRRQPEQKPVDWVKPVVFVKPPSNAWTVVKDRYGKLEEQFSKMDERRGIPRASAHAAVDILSWKGQASVKGKGKGKERGSLP